ILAAWLDDVLPGQVDRTLPPALGSDEAAAALESLHGKALLGYLALRNQGVTYARALELIGVAEEVEWYRFIRVLYGRRRTLRRGPPGSGDDLAESWWG